MLEEGELLCDEGRRQEELCGGREGHHVDAVRVLHAVAEPRAQAHLIHSFIRSFVRWQIEDRRANRCMDEGEMNQYPKQQADHERHREKNNY